MAEIKLDDVYGLINNIYLSVGNINTYMHQYLDRAERIVSANVEQLRQTTIAKLDNILKVIVGYNAKLLIFMENVTERLSSLEHLTTVITEQIQDNLIPKIELLNNKLDEFVIRLQSMLDEITDIIFEQTTEIQQTINQEFNDQRDFIKNENLGIIQNIDKSQQEISKDIKTSSIEIVDNVKSTGNAVIDNVIRSADNIITQQNSSFASLNQKIDMQIGTIAQSVNDLSSDLIDTLWAIYRDFKSWISTIINPNPDQIMNVYRFADGMEKNKLKEIGAFADLDTKPGLPKEEWT